MERKRWLGVAAGVVIVAAFAAGVSGLGGPINRAISPCHDTLGFTSPRMDVDFRLESDSVRIIFEGADTLTLDNSITLFVTVSDEERNRTERVTWAHANGSGVISFPVRTGAELTIANSDLSLNLTHGDELKVVWKGYEQKPDYCPKRRKSEPLGVAVGRYTV